MSAESTIEQILTEQQTLADSYRNYATAWAGGTLDAINRISDPEYEIEEPAFGDEGDTPNTLAPTNVFVTTDPVERETAAGVTDIPEYLSPEHPTAFDEDAPEFLEAGDIKVTTPPDEDGSLNLRANNLSFPDDPDGHINSFTDSAPTIDTSVDDIVWPDVADSFDPLDLIDVDIPDRDVDVNLPAFIDERPEFLGSTPGADDYKTTLRTEHASGLALAQASTDEWLNKHFPDYDSQVAALDTHLSNVLAGNTTAWTTQVLNSLYDRRRTQTEAEADRVREQISRANSRRGFLSDLATPLALARAEQSAHDANVVAAYEVAERVAERETAFLENARAMLNQNRTTAVQLELQKQQLIIAQNQFALSYGQAMVDVCIQAHNAAVARYNADMQRYATDAQVYEVKVKAAFAELEALKQELEVSRLQSQVNRDFIAELEAKIEVERNKIQFFTSKVQARLAQAELRRLPLEQFRANIEAHRAYLDGRRTETDVYAAIVNGRRAELDTDQAKIAAYNARVDVWAKRIAALKDKESHVLDVNRNTIEQHKLLIDRWRTTVDRVQRKNTDERGYDDVRNRRWSELIRKALADEDRQLRHDTASSDLTARYDEFGLRWAMANITNNVEKIRAQVDVLGNVTRVLGDLASATLAANGSTVTLANETLNSG